MPKPVTSSMTLTTTVKPMAGKLPKSALQLILHNALYVYNQGAKYGLPAAGARIGSLWKARIQELYSSAGSYRRYWHPRLNTTGAWTLSSQPGSPPAYQTGDLHNSVEFYIAKLPVRGPGGRFMAGFGKTAIQIYTRHPYAYDQEFGITTGAARPAWQIANLQPEGRRIIQQITYAEFVKAEIKAAARAKAGVPVTVLWMTKAREAFRP
jgi:hypothetical protein